MKKPEVGQRVRVLLGRDNPVGTVTEVRHHDLSGRDMVRVRFWYEGRLESIEFLDCEIRPEPAP